MSKNLDEFFNDVSNEIVARKKRYVGKNFVNDDMKFSFNLFSVSPELSYYKSEILCNSALSHRHDKGINYSFLFFNTGENCVRFRAQNSEISLKSGEFLVGAMQGDFSGAHEFENKFYKTQCIGIKTELARELGVLEGLDLDRNLAIKKQKISPVQRLILNELDGAKIYEGKMREIFTESKILEIIYRSFDAKRAKKERDLGLDAVNKLNKAREILLTDLQNPPSIKELARLCATNEFSLKKEFKEHFGVTIYGMLADERLRLARGLLAQNDVSVKEAAQAVGYSSFGHFSKIFKVKFGVFPFELVKAKKFYI